MRDKIKHLFVSFLLCSIITNAPLAASNPKKNTNTQLFNDQVGNSFFHLNAQKTNNTGIKKNNEEMDEIQIGNSFFKSMQTKEESIRQIGPATELHQASFIFYAFLSQILKNHIYYELRAYGIVDYISRLPPIPPTVPNVITTANERNLMGYGGVGILGYNFFLNSRTSFMPFIRLQDLANSEFAYKDIYGNELSSVNYTTLVGAKLSMLVSDVFAIYVQAYGGYQWSLLSGKGVFTKANNPTVHSVIAVYEIGAPYKLNKAWSFTPYLQLITLPNRANTAASNPPYSITNLTDVSSVYALKLGYVF